MCKNAKDWVTKYRNLCRILVERECFVSLDSWGIVDALSTWITGEVVLTLGCFGWYWEWMELVGVSYDGFTG